MEAMRKNIGWRPGSNRVINIPSKFFQQGKQTNLHTCCSRRKLFYALFYWQLPTYSACSYWNRDIVPNFPCDQFSRVSPEKKTALISFGFVRHAAVLFFLLLDTRSSLPSGWWITAVFEERLFCWFASPPSRQRTLLLAVPLHLIQHAKL